MKLYQGEVCPVCKKKFFPQPLNVYRIMGSKNVCSYSCMRAYQKRTENSSKELAKKDRIRLQLIGVL